VKRRVISPVGICDIPSAAYRESQIGGTVDDAA
jgi:hypothetical protein